MKATIIMSNEERKKIQLENNIERPKDLKKHFACFLECDAEDIEIKMEETIPKKINIRSTQELVRLVINAGNRGIGIREIKDTTLICGKSWDTESPGYLFFQFERLIRKRDIIQVDDHYLLSEDYYRRLNEPIIKRLDFIIRMV